MPYSEQQVLRQFESVFGALSRIATGRGSGAQGQQINVVLDQPIGNIRSVTAECYTPCPPPKVTVLQTNSGQWYAIGSNIGAPINTEVAQNRRSAPPPPRPGLETFMLFYQQDLVFDAINDNVYPAGEVRLYIKSNRQTLRYLTTLSQERSGYSDFDFTCIPVRSGLYVIQAFISAGASSAGVNTLDTFLVRSNGQVVQQFSFDAPTSANDTVPYPAEWSAYSAYLLPRLYAPTPDRYPPIYLEANVLGSLYEPFAFVYNRRFQLFDGLTLVNFWHQLLNPTRYKLVESSPSLTIKLSEADLAVLGLTLQTPLQDEVVSVASDHVIADAAGDFSGQGLARYFHSSVFYLGMRAGTTYTALAFVRAIP